VGGTLSGLKILLLSSDGGELAGEGVGGILRGRVMIAM
jgi:hypothetical protein